MNKEEVLEKLKSVIYPGFKKSIVEFGFVKDVSFDKEDIKILLEIPSAKKEVSDEIEKNIKKIYPNSKLEIKRPEIPIEKSNSRSGKNIAKNIKHFIMVSSGKGGVGKSTTTLNLAISMAKLGKKVGILDADIYGPNMPRMLNVSNKDLQIEGQKLRPILVYGIEMISMGLLIKPGEGLMWRGAMLNRAIEQLLSDVLWSDLDVLFIDMPPGTGDAQITIAQSVPVSAGVCVTTPQSVALDDGERGLDMFKKLHIPIAGIVENMSGFICPNCKSEYEIFAKGGADELAKKFDTKILAKIPIEIDIREGADSGKPISYFKPESEVSKKYELASSDLIEFLEKVDRENLASNAQIQPR